MTPRPGARESGPSEGPLLGQAEPTGPMEPTAQRGPDRASGRSSRSWPCRPAAVTEVSGARSPGRCGPGSGPTGRGVLPRAPGRHRAAPGRGSRHSMRNSTSGPRPTSRPAPAPSPSWPAVARRAPWAGRRPGPASLAPWAGRRPGPASWRPWAGRRPGRPTGRGSEGRNFPVRRTEGSDIAASSGLSSHTEVHRPAHSSARIVGHSSGYTRGSSVFKCKTSRIGPSGPWPSGGCARSSSRSLATPDSSPGSIGPTDSSLTSVHRYAW